MTKEKTLTQLPKKYGPGYVALSRKNRVLGFGKNLKQMFREAKRKKVNLDEASVMYVPPFKEAAIF